VLFEREDALPEGKPQRPLTAYEAQQPLSDIAIPRTPIGCVVNHDVLLLGSKEQGV